MNKKNLKLTISRLLHLKILNVNDITSNYVNWLNDYEIGTTHPLDKAHSDATMLMLPMFKKLIGE